MLMLPALDLRRHSLTETMPRMFAPFSLVDRNQKISAPQTQVIEPLDLAWAFRSLMMLRTFASILVLNRYQKVSAPQTQMLQVLELP